MRAWLVVGLGNPGERYASTRHNIGARAVARLAERLGERFRKARFVPAEVAEARADDIRLWLVRPLTFMNVSGPPVGSLVRRYRLDPGSLVVCHDEIDLPLGALKLKRGGSTAGHRGLDSVVAALHSNDFYRVRLGVGRPRGRTDPADHVLDAFARAEREDAEHLVEDAADAVLALARDGLERAQDRYNRSAPAG